MTRNQLAGPRFVSAFLTSLCFGANLLKSPPPFRSSYLILPRNVFKRILRNVERGIGQWNLENCAKARVGEAWMVEQPLPIFEQIFERSTIRSLLRSFFSRNAAASSRLKAIRNKCSLTRQSSGSRETFLSLEFVGRRDSFIVIYQMYNPRSQLPSSRQI